MVLPRALSLEGGEIRLDGHSLETLSPQQLATTVSFVTTERVRIPNLRCEEVGGGQLLG